MRRTLILLYGVLAYCAFFVTMLYAIGFVGDAVVPKGINGGTDSPLIRAVLIDFVLVLLFGVTHSIMARSAFKKQITKLIPVTAERSTYVLVASAQLALLFWLWQPITILVWRIDNANIAWLIRGISLSGWIMVFWSSCLVDHFDLFGLRQVWLNFRGTTYSQRPFIVRGLYKYVRHPLMFGFLVAFWATPVLTVGHFIFALTMTIYILIGIFFEERDLLRHLGEGYARYQQRTAMIVPWSENKNK